MSESPPAESAPPLALVKRLEGLKVEGSKASGQFVVEGLPGDDGEFEFVFVARVPSLEVSGDSGAPLDATIRKDIHVLAVEMKAIGGTPLSEELIEVVDPDSDERVGEPVRTDEKGVLRVVVPEKKAYRLRALPDGGADAGAPPTVPLGDRALDLAILVCIFTDDAGRPLANEKVKVSGQGEPIEATTDAEGEIERQVAAGAYDVEVRGQKLKAHTVLYRDFHAGRSPPYRFVIAAGGEPAQR